MLEVLEDPSLKKIHSIQHGFFTRSGGVSRGIYASLNCTYASPDNPNHVRENRRRVAAHFGYELNALVSVQNMHSNQVVIIDKPSFNGIRQLADGMVTKLPNVLLGSSSADCPTLLFYDDRARVIGLSHAGWRGAKDGVIESTIEKMVLLGADPTHISAAISPCIHQESYEITSEFYEAFLEQDMNNKIYFETTQKANHFLFNLPEYVKGRLAKLNIKSISSEVSCNTYTDERFFSRRRAFKKGESAFGCNFSCLVMRE